MASVGGVFKTIGKVAFPFITLAAQAGGPFTAMAAGAVGKALGLDKPPDATPEAIESVLSKAVLDPHTQAALIKADQDFRLQMETLTQGRIKNEQDFEAHLAQIAADDRANARAREIATRDWLPKVLAISVIVITLGLEGFVLMRGLPTGVDPVIGGRIMGTLDAAVMLVLSYYFGSSAGSASKDQTLADIAKGN